MPPLVEPAEAPDLPLRGELRYGFELARLFADREFLFPARSTSEAPVLLVPCHTLPRAREMQLPFHWANLFADAHTATWSFMLAARERGLGTSMTTVHLLREEEAAAVLGIDYERVIQTALIPVRQIPRVLIREFLEVKNFQQLKHATGDFIFFLPKSGSARERMDHATHEVKMKCDPHIIEYGQTRK